MPIGAIRPSNIEFTKAELQVFSDLELPPPWELQDAKIRITCKGDEYEQVYAKITSFSPDTSVGLILLVSHPGFLGDEGGKIHYLAHDEEGWFVTLSDEDRRPKSVKVSIDIY